MFISYQYEENGFIGSKVLTDHPPIRDRQLLIPYAEAVETSIETVTITDEITGLPVISKMPVTVEKFKLQGKIIDPVRRRIYEGDGKREYRHRDLNLEMVMYETARVVARLRQEEADRNLAVTLADQAASRADDTYERQEKINAGILTVSKSEE